MRPYAAPRPRHGPPRPRPRGPRRSPNATWSANSRCGAPSTRFPTPTPGPPGRRARTWLAGGASATSTRESKGTVPAATASHNFSARELADTIDPRLTRDTHWPRWSGSSKSPTATATTSAASPRRLTARPLPDEQPAAALRWRLVDALATSRSKHEVDPKEMPSTPSRHLVRRGHMDEPKPASPRPPEIDYARAFGNKPSPGAGIRR